MVYNVGDAMAEALSRLDRISSHFRDHEQHTVANEVGRLSIMMVDAITEGLAHLPSNKHSFRNQGDGGRHAVAHPPIRDMVTLQEQAVMALLNEVEKGEKEKSDNGARGLLRPSASAGPSLSQPGSWAQVAGSVLSFQGSPRDAEQFVSPMSLTPYSPSKAGGQHSSGEGENGREPVSLPSLNVPEFPEKAGIIRVHGRIAKDSIQYITSRIHEGPLLEVRVETNGRTRVVFQHASHALELMRSHQNMEDMVGIGRFGLGYSIELAEIVNWNDDHRRMNQPTRERRRLSFARKRLFADHITPEKWKHDIRSIAGVANIDFLWVFNSGNATAVFTSTSIARKVLEVFDRLKEGRNPYSGVSVTYSSDPCEKDLVLVRESNRPSNRPSSRPHRGGHAGKKPIR
ncbi:uncharacterized protein BJX67DRAFT_380568 [Aspergillus lucknowensis]|uniref:Uncharacterized protein n=1 Tax=Aspergillus lucknowensis TaxID=176173 RepID=A0ABR4LU17_9EURO